MDRGIPANAPGRSGNVLHLFFILPTFETVELQKSEWDSSCTSYRRLEAPAEELRALSTWVHKWRTQYLALRGQLTASTKRNELSPAERLASLLRQQPFPIELETPIATAEDIQLCSAWANLQPQNFSTTEQGVEALALSLGDYDAARLLSARLAERTALAYYRNIYGHAVDVSITQLRERRSEWITHDIETLYPVDVKNARPSFNGKGRYVEHCIPKHKEARNLGEVTLFGVRSLYIAKPEALSIGGHKAVALGEVKLSEIRQVANWADRRFDGIFSASGLCQTKKIPGWLFDYPKVHYPAREEAFQLAEKILSESSKEKIPTILPGWTYVTAGHISPAHTKGLPESKIRIIHDLRHAISHCGLSKRTLIIYMIGGTLESLLRDKDPQEFLRGVNWALSPSNSALANFGLLDPLGYLESFLSLTRSLGAGLREIVKDIHSFRLVSPFILQALRKSRPEPLTVVAYCGGWHAIRNVRCGKLPLVYGDVESCSACSRLVCNECGSCQDGCDAQSVRQQRLWDQYRAQGW